MGTDSGGRSLFLRRVSRVVSSVETETATVVAVGRLRISAALLLLQQFLERRDPGQDECDFGQQQGLAGHQGDHLDGHRSHHGGSHHAAHH